MTIADGLHTVALSSGRRTISIAAIPLLSCEAYWRRSFIACDAAADYQENEYTLLGMAIKYAGLRGNEVRVIGKAEAPSARKDKIQ